MDYLNDLGGDDTLAGTRNNDELNGGGGNDILNGRLGDGQLIGGDGRDIQLSNQGDDVIEGGADDDVLNGEFDALVRSPFAPNNSQLFSVTFKTSPELPLKRGAILPEAGLSMAGCLRDGAPDAWGRRVILNRIFGRNSKDIDIGELDELTYLLASGSDRIGALDFQRSPSEYIPRTVQTATLKVLLSAAEKVKKGVPLTPELDQALFHGTSLGGAVEGDDAGRLG